MPWTFRLAAPLIAAVALTGFAALSTPVAAQTGSTASPAPTQDATETAGPRRRPLPRSQARRTDIRRTLDRRPAHPDSIRLVSSPSETVESESRSAASRLAMVEATLRGDGPNWMGIPYRWGGTTRRGIDCSAFVQQYVQQNLGIDLPRTTAHQRYEGVHVEKEDLVPGDLVFFRRRGTRHVGVYLSGGEFIHASSSRGVTISNLSESYWDRYYWMSRRILSEPSGRRPTPRAGARG